MNFSPLLPTIFCLGLSLTACENAGVAPVENKSPTSQEIGGFTVYVAPNGSDSQGTGSVDKPWASIQFAVDNVIPGSLIRVEPGTYQELIKIEGSLDSGVAGYPVIIKGETGAIIDASNISPIGDQGILTIENASHIIVAGLELRNYKTESAFSTDATPAGIVIRGTGTDITLLGNKVHGIEENATCTQNDNNCDSTANGIGVYGNTSGGLTDIRITDNEVYNNILGASEALTINGNVDGFYVADNYVHDNNNMGIDVIGYESDTCPNCTTEQNRARNGIVRANRVENNSIANFIPNPWYDGEAGNAGGIYVDGGHHILIERNISTGNDLGLEIASEAAGGKAEDIIVASNWLYHNFELGIALGGYAASTNGDGGGSVERVHVINNSLYHNSGHSSEITMSYRIHDLRFVNNIIYGEMSINENYEQAAANIQSSGLFWDNNLWWASGTIDAVPVSDANQIVADPGFIDIANGSALLSASSMAGNAGRSETDISTWSGAFWDKYYPNGTISVHGSKDLYRKNRVVGTIDIGATEQ